MTKALTISPHLEKHAEGLWTLWVEMVTTDGDSMVSEPLLLTPGIPDEEVQVEADLALDFLAMKVMEKFNIKEFEDRRDERRQEGKDR